VTGRRRRRGWLERHRIAIATACVAALGASALVVYAALAEGNPPHYAALNDAGVWVSTNTSADGAAYGQISVPTTKYLNAVFPESGASSVDVLQTGAAVLGWDRDAGALTPVDPDSGTLRTADVIKIGAYKPALGGDDRAATLAVLDQDNGKVWLSHVDSTSPPDFSAVSPDGKPAVLVGAKADVAVGVDATVYAASLAGGVWTIKPTGGGFVKTVHALPHGLNGSVQVTVVGTTPVVLVGGQDPDPQLVIPGRAPIAIGNGRNAVLQQPGAANSVVYLATPTQLISVDIHTGAVHAEDGVNTGSGASAVAAPYYLRGCVFAAWGNASSVFNNRNCGTSWQSKTEPASPGQQFSTLEYRENHGYLLLNDPGSGAVFTVDGTPQQIDTWNKVHRPKSTTQTTTPNPDPTQSKKPPTAEPDRLGARAGSSGAPRVTVLHVLDNDSVGAGSVLSISSYTQPSTSRASVDVAPDGLSLLLTTQADPPPSFTFTYTNSNGSKTSKPATVSISIVEDGVYKTPNLRPGEDGSTLPVAQTWSVPVNGTLSIPVLNDWRDYGTGDAVALQPLDQSNHLRGRAITTTDGTIEYQAPNDPGADTITYTTSDGTAVTAPQKLHIKVISAQMAGAPPVANGDYVRAAVGATFTYNPLLNDLPGSDPLSPNAHLAIQGRVRSAKKGLVVTRQADDGTLTLQATAAGPYSLTYADTYGSLTSTPATIRVDVLSTSKDAPIKAGADSVTVHGTTPALVDVLNNDYDPNGLLLTVVGNSVADGTNLTAAVVQGRWVRVNVVHAQTTPAIETLTYTVADGVSGKTAIGQIQVNELPTLAPTPLPVTDYAVVRQGDEATIPVLDNDLTEDGSALTLEQDFRQAKGVQPLPPGQLPVQFIGRISGNPGTAFVAGNAVRFIAPRTPEVRSDRQVQITYRVLGRDGSSQTGVVLVTITPPGTPVNDRAPVPQDLQARVVAGGRTVIRIPTSGVDPDGDTVQVVGLAQNPDLTSGPQLGYIVQTSANSMTYEAFPSASNGGTDTFQYTVVDTYGVQATASISVSVVQPTVLPPPVPHNISVTAAPGTTINVKVISPAHVDYPEGDPPTLVDPSSGDFSAAQHVSLTPGDPGSLQIPVPNGATAMNVAYSVRSDAGDEYPAGVTVNVEQGYVAPPIAVDQFAHFAGKPDSVTVDLLQNDVSQVAGATLRVTSVGAGTLKDAMLTIPVGKAPQIVPYVISDSYGGEAAAVVYVPAGGDTGLPYWNGKKITISHPGAPYPVDIHDYVKDPANRPVQLTTSKAVWVAPTGGVLTASIKDGTHITLTSGKDGSGNLYQGPASLTFPVITGKDINAVTYISVPVIVGNPAPVLRCPDDQVPVTQDSQTAIDIATQCHVWTAGGDASGLSFDLSFAKAIAGVQVARTGVHKPVIAATSNAPRMHTGTLTVAVHGIHAPTAVLNVIVVPAKPLQIASIPVQTVKAGISTTIDLAPYLWTPFGNHHGALHLIGSPSTRNTVAVQAKGAQAITVTPQSKKDLAATIRFTVGDNSDRSRDKSATLELQILDVPSAPRNVVPRPGFKDKTIPIDWVASQPRGAAITTYKVEYASSGSGWSSELDAGPDTSFPVPVPANSTPYRFRVKGCNGVKISANSDGCGDWSEVSAAKEADTIPGPVTNLTVSIPPGPGSTGPTGSLRLDWTPPQDDSGEHGFKYTITWAGGHVETTGKSTSSALLTGLPNDLPLMFTVSTQNQASQGPGAPQTEPGQSAGKPATPTWPGAGDSPPPFEATNSADGSSRIVTVNWNSVDYNGPKPTHYTVYRSDNHGSGQIAVCDDVTTNTCNDNKNVITNNGTLYTYSVVAWNSAGKDATRRSDFSSGVGTAPLPMRASATPDGISSLTASPTGVDQQAQLSFDLGPSHGDVSIVTCTMSVAGGPTKTCSGSPWSFDPPNQAHGGVTETVNGLTNGSNATFNLVACNDDPSASQHDAYSGSPCKPASPVSTVSYGPFGPPSVGLSVNGNQMTWTVNGNANGRAVSIHVTDQQNQVNTTFVAGPTTYSNSASFTLPPTTTDQVTATVSDTGSSPTQRTQQIGMSPQRITDPLTLSSGPNCGGPSGTSVSCSWGAAQDKGSVTYHLSWSGGSATTSQTSYTMGGLPQDGAGHTFSVYATDDTGHTSGTASTGYTDPPNPSWQVTVSVSATCPQADFQHKVYFPGPPPSCSTGFIYRNTILTVVCYMANTGWYDTQDPNKDDTWYRISGGTWNGKYVVRSDVTGSVAGMPSC
jgi:hypothetical protein